MKYAIIAAGEGSRLREEGIEVPKPMVSLRGEMLIERLIRIFKSQGAEEISIIINAHSPELRRYLEGVIRRDSSINLIVETTPSSAHSFYAILNHSCRPLEELCLTTVDTIFSEEVFKSYIDDFNSRKDIDALMATTDYVDDEKPLWVRTDERNRILEFSSSQKSERALVSGGIYCLRKKALSVAFDAMEQGVERMRNYQQMLVEKGCEVFAFNFGKILDIDHAGDIDKAECFLESQNKRVLCIERAERFSAGCEQKDKRFFDLVCQALEKRGMKVSAVGEDFLSKEKLQQADCVVSMARSEAATDMLNEVCQAKIGVINSPEGVRNCSRARLNTLLQDMGIAIPQFVVVSRGEAASDCVKGLEDCSSWWVKRADAQTMCAGDVVRARSEKELARHVEEMFARQIDQCLVCEHICGRLVKVYHIAESEFLEYFFPSADKFSDLENISGEFPDINRKFLKQLSDKVARVLKLCVFGMDLIQTKEGKFYVIDVNDFPSFSDFALQAAEVICDKIEGLCNRKRM